MVNKILKKFVIYYQFDKEGKISSLQREVMCAKNKEQAVKQFNKMIKSRLEDKEEVILTEIYELIRF